MWSFMAISLSCKSVSVTIKILITMKESKNIYNFAFAGLITLLALQYTGCGRTDGGTASDKNQTNDVLTPGKAINAIDCVQEPPGIVSWWPGDQHADDIRGSNDGALINGVTYSSGIVDLAFSFDGDFVEVSDAEDLRISNEITIDAWIRPTTSQQTGGIVTKFGTGPATGYGLFFRGDQNGVVDGFIGKDNSFVRVRSNKSIPLNQYTHIAMTYDGTRMKVFIDGGPAGSTATTGAIDQNNVRLTIGARDNDGTMQEFFQGQIDELAIYNRALLNGEIAAIFAAGSDGNCKSITGTEEDLIETPNEIHLSQNYPNPFNPDTEIQFQLPASSHILLNIYNTNGQQIRTLVDGVQQAGLHTFVWNGQDNNGKPLASGIYLYRLQTGSFSQVRKMTLLR